MKPKTMILMVVAVVCGLGASYMTSRLLAEREEKPPEPPPIEKITLLVTKKNLDMHTALGKKPEDFFTERSFVKDDAPPGSFTKEDLPKLKSKFLVRALRKGDTITSEDLMDNKFGLKNLPNGMRAVGIRVDVAAIAGGFASLPGSHVDLMWSAKDVAPKCLLEDVIVLAADASDKIVENGGAMVASVVTVALTPEDTIKVINAMDTGSIRLVLRNLEEPKTGDPSKTKSDVAKADNLEHPATGDRPREEVKDVPPQKVAQKPKTTPQGGIRKLTQTVFNGQEMKEYHYYLDANNNIVRPQSVDQDDDDPAPTPAPGAGKEKK
jgi:Flp pilus assembly protein CpaB